MCSIKTHTGFDHNQLATSSPFISSMGKGYVEFKTGAKTIPVVVLKSDGTSLYITRYIIVSMMCYQIRHDSLVLGFAIC